MKLYVIYKYEYMVDRATMQCVPDPDNKEVIAILDEETKTEFFKCLNMFVRDNYDYEEFDLNDIPEDAPLWGFKKEKIGGPVSQPTT